MGVLVSEEENINTTSNNVEEVGYTTPTSYRTMQEDIEELQDDVTSINSNLSTKADKITYSTDEVDTGNKWVDGKPIYRKCFDGTLTSYTDSGSRRNFNRKISENVDKLLNVSGCFSDTQANYKYVINSTDADTSMGIRRTSSTGVNSNNELFISIDVRSSLSITSINCNTYFEYTKTTD